MFGVCIAVGAVTITMRPVFHFLWFESENTVDSILMAAEYEALLIVSLSVHLLQILHFSIFIRNSI